MRRVKLWHLPKKIVFFGLFCSLAVANAETTRVVVQEKTALCVACHGKNGISPNDQWPHIAGQHAKYLLKQLQDYKISTHRNASVMRAVASSLTLAEMQALADFYAKQAIPEGRTPKRYLERGEQLYRGGDFAKHITACIACHGPHGTGNEEAGFPVLSGQNAAFTVQQLNAFKTKIRSNDFNAIMQDISARMSQEDMEAVAFYVQGLH